MQKLLFIKHLQQHKQSFRTALLGVVVYNYVILKYWSKTMQFQTMLCHFNVHTLCESDNVHIHILLGIAFGVWNGERILKMFIENMR